MEAYEFSIVKTVIISAVIVLYISMNCLVIAVIVRYPAMREDRTTLFVFSVCIQLAAQSQALSKLIAILKPLRYEQLLNCNRCYGIIVFNWVVSAALAATMFTIVPAWDASICAFRYPDDNRLVSILILITYVLTASIPGIALIFTTSRMFIVVVRTKRDITDQLQMLAAGTGRDAYNTGLATLQAIRSAKNILIICFVSMALGVPLLTFGVLHYAAHTRVITNLFDFTAVWLYHSNSFVNSFLYLVLSRSVRAKIVRMFTDIRNC